MGTHPVAAGQSRRGPNTRWSVSCSATTAMTYFTSFNLTGGERSTASSSSTAMRACSHSPSPGTRSAAGCAGPCGKRNARTASAMFAEWRRCEQRVRNRARISVRFFVRGSLNRRALQIQPLEACRLRPAGCSSKETRWLRSGRSGPSGGCSSRGFGTSSARSAQSAR
jgi:hypothetical protein